MENKTKTQIIETILETVSKYTGTPIKKLQSSSRLKEVAEAKHIARYMLYYYTTLSQKGVIENTGGINHTSTIHSINRLSDLCATEKATQQLVHNVEAEIASQFSKVEKMWEQKKYLFNC
jgi:chromosomal replication initiator protein